MTARSVNVSWNEIECIERNGMITNYTVEFLSLGGSVIPGVLMMNERRFTANGLTPFTNYTFRVAGVNSINRGPFSDLTIRTAEDSMFKLRRLCISIIIMTDILFSLCSPWCSFWPQEQPKVHFHRS